MPKKYNKDVLLKCIYYFHKLENNTMKNIHIQIETNISYPTVGKYLSYYVEKMSPLGGVVGKSESLDDFKKLYNEEFTTL